MGIAFECHKRWVGIGVSGGLYPELRLGWVRWMTYRGELISQIAALRDALKVARDALRTPEDINRSGQ